MLDLAYWKNKPIFITGATGFVAKVLVEKLLRDFEDECGDIYLLIRSKTKRSKQADVADRLLSAADRLREEIFDAQLFDVMRSKRADFEELFFKKVHAVSGELACISGKGIIEKQADLDAIQKNVQIFVHSAASVSFSEPLHDALRKNVVGALEVFELARSCKNLQVYCHVSTAYVNCYHLRKVTETVPTLHFPQGVSNVWELYELLRSLDTKELDRRTPKLLGNFPNTYCYSKAIAENLLKLKRDDIRLVIVRPSIVSPSYAEPMPGWVDCASAVSAVNLFYGLGVLRVMRVNSVMQPDVVPVDVVCSCILAAVPSVAANEPFQVLHATIPNHSNYTWLHQMNLLTFFCEEYPLERAVAPANIDFIGSSSSYWFHFNARYKIPLFLLGVLARILPSPERSKQYKQLKKVVAGIEKNSEAFLHFTSNEWTFDRSNMNRVFQSFNQKSLEKLQHSPTLDTNLAIVLQFYGLKKFLLKEPSSFCPEDCYKDILNGISASPGILESQVKKSIRERDLLDYVDSLLLFAPPALWLTYRAVMNAAQPTLHAIPAAPPLQKIATGGAIGTKVTLMSLASTTTAPLFAVSRAARLWLVTGGVLFAVKRIAMWRRAQRRLALGQDPERVPLVSLFEKDYVGFPLPIIFGLLLWILGRRKDRLAPGMVYAAKQSSWLWRILSLNGWRGAIPIWAGFGTFGLYQATKRAASLGIRPVRWHHIGTELPRWRKTLLLASIVMFIRSGKGRENKGMHEWLRAWELGRI